MEVDYVHAQIERGVKNKNIYSPSSYITLIGGAKKQKVKALLQSEIC